MIDTVLVVVLCVVAVCACAAVCSPTNPRRAATEYRISLYDLGAAEAARDTALVERNLALATIECDEELSGWLLGTLGVQRASDLLRIQTTPCQPPAYSSEAPPPS